MRVSSFLILISAHRKAVDVSHDLFFERISPIGEPLRALPLTASERISLSSFRGFSQEQCRVLSH